jgi:hypothetical protein
LYVIKGDMNMKHHIFDLDGTVICSKHRQRLKANGDLDLDHWIAHMADRDSVMSDTLLPFVDFWKRLQNRTAPSICTSRTVSHLEYEFLESHGLKFERFMNRSAGDFRDDATYKVAKIREHLDLTGWDAASTTLYDDHEGVRVAVKSILGLRVFNPVPYNTITLKALARRNVA